MDVLERAHRAHDMRDWPAAAALYRTQWSRVGDDDDLLVKLADVLVEMADPAGALAALDGAQRAAPRSADVALRQAEVLRAIGDENGSRSAARRAYLLQPTAEARARLGAIAFHQEAGLEDEEPDGVRTVVLMEGPAGDDRLCGLDPKTTSIAPAPADGGGLAGAMSLAARLGADLLWLGPRARLTVAGVDLVAAAFAADPLLGFLCATSDSREARLRVAGAARYVAALSSDTVWIRGLILTEFGPLDRLLTDERLALQDFACAANACGHRICAAPFAVGARADSCVADTESDDAAILRARRPEMVLALTRAARSTEAQVDRLLAASESDAQGRRTLLLIADFLRAHFDGTAEHAVALAAAFVRDHAAHWRIHVECSLEAAAFHGLAERLPGATIGPTDSEARFSAAVRLAQPFKAADVQRPRSVAAVCGFMMLDAIAMDAQQLDADGLEEIWGTALAACDLAGFISNFSARQFSSRFRIPADVQTFVGLCSTAAEEYRAGPDAAAAPPADGPILLVGNGLPHKRIDATLAVLRALEPQATVMVFGRGDEAVTAGTAPSELVDALYRDARVVLFPSMYEGFGLPVMHALARRRPVIARDLPLYHELAARCPQADNLHLYATTAQMVRAAAAPVPWSETQRDVVPQRWRAAAVALARALEISLRRLDRDRLADRLRIARGL